MNYTVVWAKKAEAFLTEIWLDADHPLRSAISDACKNLEAALRNSPAELGESRSRDRRVAIENPLTIVFKISPLDRVVTVLDVRVHADRR